MSKIDSTKDGTIQLLDEPFRCQICNHDKFDRGKAQLNTALASFLNFDWTNKSADYVACRNCGYLHWFLPK